MLTQRIVAGFILAGLAGAAIASDANAQSGRLRVCQEECAGNPACLRTCGGSAGSKTKTLRPLPRPEPEPEPPAVKPWQDEVFARGKDGGGGGGGSGGGR